MKSTDDVGGMTCQGCVNAVTRALTRAVPGAKVAVDLAQGKVSFVGQGDDEVIFHVVILLVLVFPATSAPGAILQE